MFWAVRVVRRGGIVGKGIFTPESQQRGATGNKVSCFLDNLVNPMCSQRVTVDTHMERFLLGAGRRTLSAAEYAVCEDFYRCMSAGR